MHFIHQWSIWLITANLLLITGLLHREVKQLDLQTNKSIRGGWDKSPNLSIILDCRARPAQWLSALLRYFIALQPYSGCAEVGRRNRILTNYRFLSATLLCLYL